MDDAPDKTFEPQKKPEETNHDLDALRKIILGGEEHRLSSLEYKVNNVDEFSEHLSNILPDALDRSAQKSEDLTTVLVPTVDKIVRLSIKKDINQFADALFPVIGPAIRKSIQETIRQMLHSMNHMLESTLSWQGLKWRIESLRTGIPFAQIVLLNGLLFRVEQVFLIHRETGLLLQHVSVEESPHNKADLVSSMLSAIEDFVKDSFEHVENQNLGSIQVGGLAIWIEQSPDFLVAAAISGSTPPSLRITMQESVEAIQLQYSNTATRFDGNTSDFNNARPILENCLVSQVKSTPKKASTKTKFILAVVTLTLVYWLSASMFHRYQMNGFIKRLHHEPGYLLTSAEHNGGVLVLKGLKDPLALSAKKIATEENIQSNKLKLEFQPYHSLEPAILIKRITRMIQPPESVELRLSDDTLYVSGAADKHWQGEFKSIQKIIPGVSSVVTNLTTPHPDFNVFQAPESVHIEWLNNTLVVSGEAKHDWIKQFKNILASHEMPVNYDISKLVDTDLQNFEQLIAKIEATYILFPVQSATPTNATIIQELTNLTLSLFEYAQKLEVYVSVDLLGNSDSTGNINNNIILSKTRAEYVANKLQLGGIASEHILIQARNEEILPERSDDERRLNRRVSITVHTCTTKVECQ